MSESLEMVERLHTLAERVIEDRSIDREVGAISCDQCRKTFRSARAAEEHRQIHERYGI